MINTSFNRLADTGEIIETFELKTKKGYAYGFVHKSTLYIHHIGKNIGQEHPVKGIMDILTKRFNTNKFRFLMLINNNLPKSIKGKIVKIPADAEGNPFGRELTELHGVWER